MTPTTLYQKIKDAPPMIRGRGNSVENYAELVRRTLGYAERELGKPSPQRDLALPFVKNYLRQAIMEMIWLASSGGRVAAEKLAVGYERIYREFGLKTELPDEPVNQSISIDDLVAAARPVQLV